MELRVRMLRLEFWHGSWENFKVANPTDLRNKTIHNDWLKEVNCFLVREKSEDVFFLYGSQPVVCMFLTGIEANGFALRWK